MILPRRHFIYFCITNTILLFLYLWSFSGSTTKFRIEVIGNTYTAYVDGVLTHQATIEGFSAGGIGFSQLESSLVPSLPQQQAVDFVRVIHPDTGEVIFSDDFSAINPIWKNEDQAWYIDSRGMYTTDKHYAKTTTGHQPWQDYILEMEINTCLNIDVYVRVTDLSNAVVYSFSPWRDLNSVFLPYKNGALVNTAVSGPGLRGIAPREGLRAIARAALQSYPYALATVVILVLAACLMQFILPRQISLRLPNCVKVLRFVPHACISVLVIGSAANFYYYATELLERIPHVPDEVAYLTQARIFAGGKLYAPEPPFSEHFHFSGSLIFHNGKWFSQYPFGHPLALALGYLFGAPWIIPPLLAAASVLLVFLIGKELHNSRAGLASAALLYCSPFFQMNGATFMSHNTALFYLNAFLLGFIRCAKRGGWVSSLSAGVFLGLLLNTRPLTAAFIVPPFALFALYECLCCKERLRRIRSFLPMGLGSAVLLLLYFLYNYALTGNMLVAPYTLGGTAIEGNLGISENHPWARALMDYFTNIAMLITVIHGWPSCATFLFIFALFLLRPVTKFTVLLGAAAFTVPFGYLFYNGNYIMYGPRFWYEITSLITLLTVLGVESVCDSAAFLAARVTGSNFLQPAPITAGSLKVLCYLIISYLSFGAMYSWYSKDAAPMHSYVYVPSKMYEFVGFNSAQNKLGDSLAAQNIHDALVFVSSPSGAWWEYGISLYHTSPFLIGDIIYAIDLGNEKNTRIMELFPQKKYFRGDYYTGAVLPYSRQFSSLQ